MLIQNLLLFMEAQGVTAEPDALGGEQKRKKFPKKIFWISLLFLYFDAQAKLYIFEFSTENSIKWQRLAYLL